MRQDFGKVMIDADLVGDCRRRARIVARQHVDFQSQFFQLGNCRFGIWLERVRDGNQPCRFAVDCREHRRLAFIRQFTRLRFQAIERDVRID